MLIHIAHAARGIIIHSLTQLWILCTKLSTGQARYAHGCNSTRSVMDVTKYFLIGLRLCPQEGFDIWHPKSSQRCVSEEVMCLGGKSPSLKGHDVLAKLLSTQPCLWL